jgi:hypothetical protein
MFYTGKRREVMFMSNCISETAYGVCPEIGECQEIKVTFAEVRSIGGKPGYKRVSFYCGYEDEHKCSDPNNCPLYLSASWSE